MDLYQELYFDFEREKIALLRDRLNQSSDNIHHIEKQTRELILSWLAAFGIHAIDDSVEFSFAKVRTLGRDNKNQKDRRLTVGFTLLGEETTITLPVYVEKDDTSYYSAIFYTPEKSFVLRNQWVAIEKEADDFSSVEAYRMEYLFVVGKNPDYFAIETNEVFGQAPDIEYFINGNQNIDRDVAIITLMGETGRFDAMTHYLSQSNTLSEEAAALALRYNLSSQISNSMMGMVKGFNLQKPLHEILPITFLDDITLRKNEAEFWGRYIGEMDPQNQTKPQKDLVNRLMGDPSVTDAVKASISRELMSGDTQARDTPKRRVSRI